MFHRPRPKSRFLSDVLRLLMPFGGPCGTILQEKIVPKIASKKGPRVHKKLPTIEQNQPKTYQDPPESITINKNPTEIY